MAEHQELEAMRKIAEALEPLDEPARQRALQWAFSRYHASRTPPGPSLDTTPGRSEAADRQTPFETFAELFEAADPKTESEKALVASYWEQVGESQLSFASQTLNARLKDLGHGVGNITEALSALKNEKPALVLQLKKSGTSRQARKTYKLTVEGMRRVQGMLRDAPVSDE
jgi:hypothetical protein